MRLAIIGIIFTCAPTSLFGEQQLIPTQGMWRFDNFRSQQWSQQVWTPQTRNGGQVVFYPDPNDSWMGLMCNSNQVGKLACARLGTPTDQHRLPLRITWDIIVPNEPPNVSNRINGVIVGTSASNVIAGQFGNATGTDHRGKFVLQSTGNPQRLSGNNALDTLWHIDLYIGESVGGTGEVRISVYNFMGHHMQPDHYLAHTPVYTATTTHNLNNNGNNIHFFATINPYFNNGQGDTVTTLRGVSYVRNVWISADSLPPDFATTVIDNTLRIPVTEYPAPNFAAMDAETGQLPDQATYDEISALLAQAEQLSQECRDLIEECAAKGIPTWRAEGAVALYDIYGWITREHLQGKVLTRNFYGSLGGIDHTYAWYEEVTKKHSPYRMGRLFGNGPEVIPLSDDQIREVLNLSMTHARSNAHFLVNLLSQVKEDMNGYLAGQQPPLPAPIRPKPSEVKIKDGQFRDASGRPVFLLGPYERNSASLWMEELAKIGLNHIQFDWFNTNSFRDPQKTNALISRVLSRAEQLGFFCSFQALFNFPWDWAPYPDQICDSDRIVFSPYNVLHPSARRAIEHSISTWAPALGTSPALNIVELSNQPFHLFKQRDMKLLFGQWAEAEYGSLESANTRWGTSFSNWEQFAALSYDDLAPYPGLKYDWLNWQRRNTTQFYAWVKDTLRRYSNRQHDLTTQLVGALTIGEYPIHLTDFHIQTGVDPEEVFRDVLGISATDGEIRYLDLPELGYTGPLAINSHHSIYVYDIYRSLAPDNPVADQELYLTGHKNLIEHPQHYFRTALWQAVLHGASQISMWKFQEGSVPSDVSISDVGLTWDHAAHAWAIGQTAIELQRYSPIIDAFGRQRGRVAMLYSRTSQFLDWKNNVDSQHPMYRALLYSGQRPSFVTERQLLESDGDIPYRVLIAVEVRYLPSEVLEKIRTFVQNGGILLVVGRAFESTPYGEPLDTSDLLPQAMFIPPGPSPLNLCTQKQVGNGRVYRLAENMTTDFYLRLLDEIYRTYNLYPRVRLVDEEGRYINGLDSRYVEVDGKGYIYAVNLLRTPVHVTAIGTDGRLRRVIPPPRPIPPAAGSGTPPSMYLETVDVGDFWAPISSSIRLAPASVELFEVAIEQ